jgi:hypothetical protein
MPSGRKYRLQLGPWCHGRRWELNSARGRLGSAGKGRGSAQGLTYDRFVLTDGVGKRPAAACDGSRRFLPLELLLRCDGRRGSHTSGTGRFGGPWGAARKCWTAAKQARGGGPRERTGSRQQRVEGRPAAVLIAGDSFFSPRSKDLAFNPAVRWPSSTCVRRDRCRTARHPEADEYGVARAPT